MTRLAALPVTFLALWACTPPLNEDNAALLLAKAACSKEKKCSRDDFDDVYDDKADCVDTVEGRLQTVFNGLDFIGLEFNQGEARSCHSDIRTASCDTYNQGSFSSACDGVFGF